MRDRNTSTSALAEHVCNTGHPVDWSQTHIRNMPLYIEVMLVGILDDPKAAINVEQRKWPPTSFIQTSILNCSFFF